MKKKITVLTLCAMLFALCFPLRRSSRRKIPRIGYSILVAAPRLPVRVEAFRQGLRELGYVEGKNIVIEYRYAEGKPIVSQSSRPSWCVSRLTSSS